MMGAAMLKRHQFMRSLWALYGVRLVKMCQIGQLRLVIPKAMRLQHLGVIPKTVVEKVIEGGMMCHSVYFQSEIRGSTSN